jgi:hypothetical protein
MSGGRVQYSWAVVRVVPHPYTGEGVPVGIVLQSRPAGFIGLEVMADPSRLARLVPDADVELVARYLASWRAIARGEAAAGDIALLPPPERFHWLTAPRSDVIQPGAVRHGVTEDPERTLRELFEEHVGPSLRRTR